MHPMPTLFLSHGAPSYALEPGIAGAGLRALGRALPRPDAVLVVSPHWMTREPRVTAAPRPETIHDFGGFDAALYEISYPVAGHPALATRSVERLRVAGWTAEADAERGLDHGAWVPLLHLYPDAGVPVFQLSMPAGLDADSAYALGRALAPLAHDNVLIVGSGSLTHNLREFFTGQSHDDAYVAEFADWIRNAVLAGDHEQLRHALERAPHAQRAHPTREHFLPLLVAAGAAGECALPATALDGGIVDGVLSMDSFVFGADVAAATSPGAAGP